MSIIQTQPRKKLVKDIWSCPDNQSLVSGIWNIRLSMSCYIEKLRSKKRIRIVPE